MDLHTHSLFSDGTDTPTELVAKAHAAGLPGIALTDHDTVAGWDEAAKKARELGIRFVRGMEVTANYGGVSVHILGYLFNPETRELQTHMQLLQDSRRERAKRIVARLAKDFPISWDDVETGGDTVGRPHIADALVNLGVIPNRSAAFADLLAPSSPYYIPQYAAEATAVVEWINAAGGKAVFAHPLAESRGAIVPDAAFAELAEAGLFGIEVEHRDNPEHVRPKLRRIAKELGLETFGSSDYHGDGKPNLLGENLTDPETVSALAEGSYLTIL